MCSSVNMTVLIELLLLHLIDLIGDGLNICFFICRHIFDARGIPTDVFS